MKSWLSSQLMKLNTSAKAGYTSANKEKRYELVLRINT